MLEDSAGKSQTRIVIGSGPVSTRLNQIAGLTEQVLQDAVLFGNAQAATVTANYPPIYRGYRAWAETVGRLRELLMETGWEKSDNRNYSTVLDPTGSFAIAVAGGDVHTGTNTDYSPTTRREKGAVTRDAIYSNLQHHFSELSLEFERPAHDSHETYLLLFYEDSTLSQVRLELSLPSGMSPDGKISSWRERIILDPVSLTAQPIVEVPKDDDYDVNVERTG